ncbi:MAG: winged helix DNA-binding domain-containing protein [Myxococcales bacterium]|nr:MAG: winged helix DNA-binding domain-containing protein [Myxococcales bacterium]
MLKDRHDIVRRRLRNQRLVGKPFTRAADVVAHHLAMQSQDYGGAKWAVGQRLSGARDADIDAELDAGRILRTHVLRPTWHFVSPADVRWLLELTAPRVRKLSEPYFRKHGLDAAALKGSRRVLENQLRGSQRTREELGRALAEAGLPVQGEALSYQLIAAELDGVIVSGARRGKQHTHALMAERVPPAPKRSRDEALRELALRYLQSHGPALPQDLSWWSGLTLAEVRRGIAACGDELESAEVAEKTYYFAPSRRAMLAEPVAHLLPNYDEQLIAYRFRGNAVDAATSARVGPGEGVFDGHLLLMNGLLVGGWRRELSKARVEVSVSLLRKPTAAEQRALRSAAEGYASFVELELALSVQERR